MASNPSAKSRSDAQKAYDKAKRKYTEAKTGLSKWERECEQGNFKAKKAAERMITRLKESIDKVTTNWEEVGEKRHDFMDEDGDPEGEEERWYIEESTIKDELVFKGEELCDDLETLFDEDAPAEGPSKRLTINYTLTGASAQPEENAPVFNQIQTQLSNVTVSKKDMVEFEAKLADQLIEKWEEDSQCKIFTGILKSKYGEFMDMFQKTTGINDTVKAAFATVSLGNRGGVKDNLKSFKCDAGKTGATLEGKYGMYASLSRPNPDPNSEDDLIDIAYSVFTFKTDLFGTKTKGSKTVVMDVLTGDQSVNRALKLKDINMMSQNFIVAKALSGFADAGVIATVKYLEDNIPSIKAQAAHALEKY